MDILTEDIMQTTFQPIDNNFVQCNMCTYKFNSSHCPMCGTEYVDLIEENFTKAYNEIPHTFFKPQMIYLKGHINGQEIKFLVDTGAEISIIPHNFIEACGLDNIIDREYKSKISGVGISNSVGKIYYVELVLSCGVYPCGFVVIENNNVPPILGMDMIQNLGLIIDFKNRKLMIGDNKIDL